MKTITVNIEKQQVLVDGQSCNFIEAGLTNNQDPIEMLTDPIEIEEILRERNDNEDIQVTFED